LLNSSQNLPKVRNISLCKRLRTFIGWEPAVAARPPIPGCRALDETSGQNTLSAWPIPHFHEPCRPTSWTSECHAMNTQASIILKPNTIYWILSTRPPSLIYSGISDIHVAKTLLLATSSVIPESPSDFEHSASGFNEPCRKKNWRTRALVPGTGFLVLSWHPWWIGLLCLPCL